jgi:predicted unusual protein kinase regulating ubiquinone biosynthesis (AarF/ABC1/UbiB family)
VSHLTAKDYEATLGDLITLGFIPPEIGADPAKAALVAPLLGTVLEQLSNGGGANAITVDTVGEEIQELGRAYPIVIPSYFGLILRAFSALEGLGLQLVSTNHFASVLVQNLYTWSVLIVYHAYLHSCMYILVDTALCCVVV